jgi:hypothetical protein
MDVNHVSGSGETAVDVCVASLETAAVRMLASRGAVCAGGGAVDFQKLQSEVDARDALTMAAEGDVDGWRDMIDSGRGE